MQALRALSQELRDGGAGSELRRSRSMRGPAAAAESMARAAAESNRRRLQQRFDGGRPGLVDLAVPRFSGEHLVDFAPNLVALADGRLQVGHLSDPAREARVRTLVIEQKSLKIRNGARNNFAWYQLLMIMLLALAFNILPVDVETKLQASNADAMK